MDELQKDIPFSASIQGTWPRACPLGCVEHWQLGLHGWVRLKPAASCSILQQSAAAKQSLQSKGQRCAMDVQVAHTITNGYAFQAFVSVSLGWCAEMNGVSFISLQQARVQIMLIQTLCCLRPCWKLRPWWKQRLCMLCVSLASYRCLNRKVMLATMERSAVMCSDVQRFLLFKTWFK